MSAKRKSQAEDLMVDLLHELSQELLNRLQSGEATPQDISNAIKLLHNNGITVAVNEGEPLAILKESLPFESEDSVLTQ